MRKRFSLLSESIIRANRRFVMVIVGFVLFYLTVQALLFYQSRSWLNANRDITVTESTTNAFYINLAELENSLLRYRGEVPLLSIGSVEEYHPRKTAIKNLLQSNRAVLSRLLRHRHGTHAEVVARLEKIYGQLTVDLNRLLFHKHDVRTITRILEAVEANLFLLKSITARIQREHRDQRAVNLARLRRNQGYNLGFLILMIPLVSFLGYMTFAFNKLINRKVRTLTEHLPTVELDSGEHIARIDYAEEDEIRPVIERFNRMIVQINVQTIELNAAKNYLVNIFESSPAMMVSLDEDGIVTQWNQAAVERTGVLASEALGRSVWEIDPLFERYRAHVAEVLSSLSKVKLEKEHLGADPQRFDNVTIFPLVSNGISGAVFMAEDVTEIEQKEQQLRQAQKMEVIGTLAGGLAHDFNNVIGGIWGTLSLIRFHLEGDGEIDVQKVRGYLDTIELATSRAESMVSQLLTVSRKREFEFERLDLADSVRNVQAICQNSFDKRIELDFRHGAAPAYVEADPTQIEQVLLNLCVNGAHAMTLMRGEGERQGGRLQVQLERLVADRIFCEAHPEAQRGAYWIVKVSDDGVGMDGKTLAKIFDPFFSTKEKGRGTGLGLAVVYNIVQQHHGFIDVYSDVGIGTTFNVYLPERVAAAASPGAEAERTAVVPGTGLILVVDDEEVMRKVAGEILAEAGYEVVFAGDGLEAVALFEARHGEIAAVLLDLAMPRMSGREAFDHLKRIDPDSRVLLTSGFREDDRVKEMLALGADGFIEKPFSLETLSQRIGAVVGGAQGGKNGGSS